jgi:hypothetical protein
MHTRNPSILSSLYKEAVLAAIAEEGFRLLSVEVESAISTAGNGTRQQLMAASNAYVNFAIVRPNRLQVMQLSSSS